MLAGLTTLLVLPSLAQQPNGPKRESAASYFSASQVKAASSGDAAAALQIGIAFHEGHGVYQNGTRAVKWLSLAEANGSMEAKAWYGDCLVRGFGTAQNVPKGTALIQAAAAAKVPAGLRFEGLLYERGYGVPRDYAKARALYTQAVQSGDTNAYDHLALLYLQGLGVAKSVKTAAGYLANGVARGDAWSELHLGQLYASGHAPAIRTTASKVVGHVPTAHDLQTAMYLLQASAAQDNRVAQYALGSLLVTGPVSIRNVQSGADYLGSSASMRYAPAEIAMGDLLSSGQGAQPDLVTAAVWYRLASLQKSSLAFSKLAVLNSKMSADEREQSLKRFQKIQTGFAGNVAAVGD